MSEKHKRLNISVPSDVARRAHQLDNVSAICAAALTTACDALESGEPRVLEFGFEITRRLIVAPRGWVGEQVPAMAGGRRA